MSVRTLARSTLIVGLSLAAASGLVYAGAQQANPVYHGCYNKISGALRMLTHASPRCTRREVSISWNQNGPQGVQGPVGQRGPQGPQGLTSAQGPQGLTGSQGLTGPQGPVGATGPQGIQGPAAPTPTPEPSPVPFSCLGCVDWSGFNGSFAPLSGADLHDTYLVGISFFGADLSYANLQGAQLSRVSFVKADLEYAQIGGAYVDSTTDFTNADLYGATGIPTVAGTIPWTNTTCPDGTNSDNNSNVASGPGTIGPPTCVGHFLN
jgi:Pentapeptide repeats (8 copies)/Collagen triple helix repeat (20 copies)